MQEVDHKVIGRGWSFPPSINAQGEIRMSEGYSDINQAIRIILTTVPGERVMRPTFGSRLHELVFAPINTQTIALTRRYVEQALTMWEPRINLVQVDVVADPDHSGMLLIEMEYEVKATYDRRTLVYPFYTIPEE